MKMTENSSKETLIGAFEKYLKWEMAAMLCLGFASGLPLMMVYSKLSFWLREVGIEKSLIGGMYAVSLAYSLKVFWAPVVDRVQLPVLSKTLGQRRAWMLVSVATTIAGLLLIGTSNPAKSLLQTVIGALVLAYGGATLDISIDAWRIESAPNKEQANMAASYTLGYRVAIFFSGMGMVIADYSSWFISYVVMAVAMGLVAVLILFIPEPESRPVEEAADVHFGRRIRDAIIRPFVQITHNFGPWLVPVMGIVALYRLSDFTMGVMASPFYADLGYSKTAVGAITGLFGPWPVVVGGFLGGFAVLRYRLMPALLWGALITVLTNGAFALLAIAAGPGIVDGAEVAVVTPPEWALLVVIMADNLAAGFVGSVFIAYLSSLTEREFAATQYALFSSAYSLFAKAVATFSGVLADWVGWTNFFLVTAGYGLPSFFLILYVMRYGPEKAQGIRNE